MAALAALGLVGWLAGDAGEPLSSPGQQVPPPRAAAPGPATRPSPASPEPARADGRARPPVPPGTPPGPDAGAAPTALEWLDDDDDNTPAATGSVWPISKDGIQGAVTEAIPALTDCYDAALERDVDLAGRISVGFVIEDIDGIGQVAVVELDEGGVTDPAMIDCALDAFEGLQFDAPSDGSTKVSYPITFRNDG